MQNFGLLIKPASGDCNIRCEYCFYYFKPDLLYPKQKVHRMEHKVLRRLMENYLGYVKGQAMICWQGGEPTLMGLDFYEKVVKMEYLFAKPGITIGNAIQTNGTLINAEWAQFFAKNKFLVGISLDGPEKIHNQYRVNHAGKGTFDRVYRATRLFEEYHVDYNILTVINNINAKYPMEMYKFFMKNNMRFLQFIPCLEKDESGNGLMKYSVSPEDFGRFLVDMFFMWVTRGKYASTADKKIKKPECFIRMFDELLMVYAGYPAPSCTFKEACGVYLMIEYNGDAYPCDFLADEYWKLGNVVHDPMPKLLKSKRFKEFVDISKENCKKCEGCKWHWLCKSGCQLHWKDAFGDRAKTNYFCESYKEFFEQADATFKSLLNFVSPNLRK